MPKLGESIIEATITRWLKKTGDSIAEDDPIAEIATDKVDSEIPSPVEGKILELLHKEGDIVPVGKVIAVIETGTGTPPEESEKQTSVDSPKTDAGSVKPVAAAMPEQPAEAKSPPEDGKFYSPLVKNIARQENIPAAELGKIVGTGKEGRVTKQDILDYLGSRAATPGPAPSGAMPGTQAARMEAPKVVAESEDEIFEMDRMRRLIADHMVMSKQVSPHVTSFIDVDVTSIVRWREKIKEAFYAREKQKLTYTPVLIEASALVLKEYPRINASADGYRIIHRKKINIGMATALPNGNLIVPVIRQADQKSLLGLVRDVNDLADRARNNALVPDEIQGGTFTVTNFGTFDSLTGTPIINQPQVAILGIGAIRKMPVVIEAPGGDMIGIRHIMILSLAYDHRVVDGALAGMFLRRLKELLESWDENRNI